MEADFSGYATKAGLKCSDGRTIMPDAFKHQDKMKVPLVWQHGHSDPENVIGHAILENRPDGVYAYGYFNTLPKGVVAKGLVQHNDINALSIWANELIERGGRVLHGVIREVSLVLSGANPGALIESVTIHHSDGSDVVLEDEAIIYSGLELEHASDGGSEDDEEDGETVQDVYNSMTDKQKDVLHFMVGEALAAAGDAEHSNLGDAGDNTAQHDNTDQEGSHMTRNIFEGGEEPGQKPVLSHADLAGIVADASRVGSLKAAVQSYALAHGITNIDLLFPDAQNVTNTPEWFGRRVQWVGSLLSGISKRPFSRIKSMSADLTMENARARGYVKGALKKEEFFEVSKRVTTPQTIYKKQKLDRDDIIDITDFDVVAWMKGEMRVMLDEELARAVLIGDGRDVASEDKIKEANIRPIATDHDLYTTKVPVDYTGPTKTETLIEAIIRSHDEYRGSGRPNLYTTSRVLTDMLLVKDTQGRRIYRTQAELEAELRVNSIVPVEAMEDDYTLLAVMVNPADYVLGADRGGQVSMFDDFDIDYNQYKYLIETRVSGALVKLKSAVAFNDTAAPAGP